MSYFDIFILPNTTVPAARFPVIGERSGAVYMTHWEAIELATVLALQGMKAGASVQTGVILPVSEAVRRATQGESGPTPYTLRAPPALAAPKSKAPAKPRKPRLRPQAAE